METGFGEGVGYQGPERKRRVDPSYRREYVVRE